jgi:hypothetical protein
MTTRAITVKGLEIHGEDWFGKIFPHGLHALHDALLAEMQRDEYNSSRRTHDHKSGHHEGLRSMERF